MAAAVIVVGAVAWFALRKPAGGDSSSTNSTGAASSGGSAGGAAGSTASSRTQQPALPDTGSVAGVAGAEDPGLDPEAQRAKELARTNAELAKTSPVPINSRPLLPTETMFLAPNAQPTAVMPAQVTKTADGKPPARDAKAKLFYVFTGDRYALVGGDTLTSTLHAWSDEAKTQPAEIKVLSAVVDHMNKSGGKLATLAYAPKAGGFANTWSPASSGLKTGTYGITVAFTDASGAEYAATLNLSYTAKGEVPARFTGKLTDRLDKGSLVVSAGIEVIDAGEYIIDANLFDGAGKPIARANFRGELAKGAKTVELVFYGKVIRDHGVAGPYVVRQLRGYRTRPGQEPNRVDMVAHPDDYKTTAYAVDVFTSEPWPTPGRPIAPSSGS